VKSGRAAVVLLTDTAHSGDHGAQIKSSLALATFFTLR
jgi:hypothetical protein